jgi:hypothetical protein
MFVKLTGIVALAVVLGTGASYAAPAVEAGFTLETLRDAATYQNVAVLHQESTQSISDEYRMKEVRPRLEFRCSPGGNGPIEVRIDWRRFISSFNTEVKFAADDAEAITVKLGVDRSNKITMTRDRVDDQRVIQYLSGRSGLTITVTPYSEAPVSAHYDLESLADALLRLQDKCSDQ